MTDANHQDWAARTDVVRAIRARAERTVAELRADTSGRVVIVTGDEPGALTWHLGEGSLAVPGAMRLTAADVADAVEGGIDELVANTVRDLWLTLRALGRNEGVTPADMTPPAVMNRWPWTVRGAAGLALYKWHAGPAPRANWPGDAAPAEVARRLFKPLQRLKHPLANDDDTPTDAPEQSEIVRLARDGRLPKLAGLYEDLRTKGVSISEPAHHADGGAWTWWPAADTAAVLPAPVLRHPDDGSQWTWWPTAMADLYLAERAAVAAAEKMGRWVSPALATQIYDRVVEATSRNLTVSDGALVSRDGHQLLLAIDSRVLTPGMSSGKLDKTRLAQTGADGKLLAHGLSLVGSYNAHKLVRYVPRACLSAKAHDQPDFRVLRFDSYAELAKAAGMKGGGHLDDDVRALAYVYDAFRVTLDDGSNDRLWTRGEYWVKTRGRPRRAITLTASPLLLPHTQEHYLDDSRWLIPLVDVPPVVGLEHAGHQATLQLLIVRHMRACAAELVEHGGVSIPDNVWRALAAKAGVPVSLLEKVRQRWLVDGNDGAAFLAMEGARYTLSPAYSAALEFLRQGGQKTLAGRKGATMAKAAKEKRIRGKRRRVSH